MDKRQTTLSLTLPEESVVRPHSPLWPQIGGPLLTLLAIIGLDLLAPTALRIPNPPAVLLLPVVYSAFTGGVRVGLFSAVMAWLYLAYFYSMPGRPLDYADDNLFQVIVWGVTTPAMALVVGLLKRRTDRLAEAARRREHYSASLLASLHERKLVEAAVHESEDRFRLVTENANDAIFTITEEGRILLTNPAAETIFGYRRDEMVGQPLTLLLPDYSHHGFPSPEHGFLGKEERPFPWNSLELMGVKKTGQAISLEICFGESVRDGQRQVIGIARDLTAHQRSDTAVQQAQRALQAKDLELAKKRKEIEEFIHAISHELKGPLVSLQGFANQLQGTLPQALGQEGVFYLERMVANARHLECLVQGLWEFHKTDQKESSLDTVELSAAIQDVLERLEYQLTARGIEIRIRNECPIITAQLANLQRVLANLITNAIEYMGNPRVPLIEIGCRENPDHWLFYVRDNGMGIPREHQQRIFTIFERLTEAKLINPKGTGLGLAIVKRIVENHGGAVWVESSVGHGSTFYFTIAKPGKAASGARRVMSDE